MTNEQLIAALRDAEAVQYGEFELSHGGTSDYYVDKYLFETDPRCLELIAEAFATKIDEPKLAGVALGAVPLVAVTSVETDLPYVIARKRPKSTGRPSGSRVGWQRAKKSSSWKTSPPLATRRLTRSKPFGRPARKSTVCSSSSTVRRVRANSSPSTTWSSIRW